MHRARDLPGYQIPNVWFCLHALTCSSCCYRRSARASFSRASCTTLGGMLATVAIHSHLRRRPRRRAHGAILTALHHPGPRSTALAIFIRHDIVFSFNKKRNQTAFTIGSPSLFSCAPGSAHCSRVPTLHRPQIRCRASVCCGRCLLCSLWRHGLRSTAM